ncbi:zinc fingers and homeoboxes protein 2a [Stegastes partitus]|uniref:Zinc fingers and homeoboxes 2 n=1 Tax=Stegastes partitus TaxID=144197 RepID=A0A3B5ATL2_9TELE|nr:PREDICTED: zinc fingers and homeoboxes protein 2 [Stegastes partitus]XP_008285137.1 PREDICTED: zinc fingers and homeoboxes protein 2 [Stegastes partitus]XP_008285138.1 PREDICTED: zinc fingers and homeoboxes protein 2 [Stegastes partitus]XP_008285139.1 PREDICTED: zinc fingers and homeoboxes protein 2 [Stegastes partitus]XP_008285140.1 PREDICTED: zinc fingers and homeoboxes protein 2 [Stegastes partitus]
MSSRRKASTPCMIRPDQTMVELDDEAEESNSMETTTENHTQGAPMDTDLSTQAEPSAGSDVLGKASDPPTAPDKPAAEPPDISKPQRRQQGGYECKYCPFSTQNLNTFKEHVDANHPNVILNPLYLCAVCNFNTKKFDTLTEHNERCHPGESNFKFKRIKMNNQTILEQTIEGCSNNAVIYNTSGAISGKGDELGTLPLSKPTTVKIGKPKIMSSDNKRTESQLVKLTPDLTKKPVTALNVNGTVIIPESTLLKADGLSHIMPSLQRPLNYTQVPKIAVPLNTTKYNPSLDDNLTLISSFNKFPYPTQAELSWLTAASKHPEEQIKVWFTTQRLKQGISWSPEEVEEARKKMFNGTISSVPQTFTVVAPQLNSSTNQSAPLSSSKPMQPAASVLQSLPCQLLGQTSLVLTPVANGSTVTCAPLALTVANQVAQSLKRPLASPVIATESKRPSIIQTISAPMATSKLASPKVLSFTVDPNKTAEQLSVLRSSYTQCPFPEEDEIYRLIENTGLSRGEIKKWFSEQRLLNLKGVPPPPVLVKAEVTPPPPPPPKDGPVKKAVPNQFPLLERVKGKSSEQLKALEESFQRSSSPTETALDQLAQETRLSKTEVDCWFSERRALRDNMEKALLTMASKNSEDRAERPGALLNGASHREQDGKSLHSSPHPPVLSSSSSSSSPPVLAASSPRPPTHSSSASPPILTTSCSSSPHPPILSASASPAPISSRSLTLLREMFCRTQWPSPEEYSQLEVQTSLGRTDIVRWFKDHRSALKNGETLDWMEGFQNQNIAEQQKAGQEQNGQSSEKNQSASLEVKALKVEEAGEKVAATEQSKQSEQDKVQWLADRLSHRVTDLSRTKQEQTSPNSADKGRWVKVTVAVGEESEGGVERPRLATDTDVLTLEQPGRVTG